MLGELKKYLNEPQAMWIAITLTALFSYNQTKDRYTGTQANEDRKQQAIISEAVAHLLERNKEDNHNWEKYLIKIDGYMSVMVESHKDSDTKIDRVLDRLPRSQIMHGKG